jgi:hypothetical protein
VRELSSEPDDAEAVELAPVLLAVSGEVKPAELAALRAAAPPGAVVVREGERPPGLDAACPARLLVAGKAAAPAIVRRALAPATRVAVAAARPPRRTWGASTWSGARPRRGCRRWWRRSTARAAAGGAMKVVVCVEPWGLSEASRAALALAARPVRAIASPRWRRPTARGRGPGRGAAAGRLPHRPGDGESLESLDVGGLGKTLAQALCS